jgi:hypothetical protein
MASDGDPTLEKIVLTRLIRMNGVVSGVVTGLLIGGGVFVATNWLLLKGGDVIGPHLALLGQFFIGYTVTFWGSIIGFLYGFVTGFIIGYMVAFLYNLFLNMRLKWRERRQ